MARFTHRQKVALKFLEMLSQEPIFLDCPFLEKDEAKELGAKFDWTKKKWFIPEGLETELFSKWLPKTVTSPVYDENSMTLNDLLFSVQQTIASQHNTYYWIRAELVSVTTNIHTYMEIADHDSEGNEIAKARATLWSHRAEALLERFATNTGLEFKAGIKVLLQVQVEFHVRYGFSLNILDIDPSFTLGEMEAKLNRIRTKLLAEGIYDQNQRFVWPTEFCKVAVIAPPKAAGLGDFKSQAKVLTAFNLCEFHYYQANFQGQNITTAIPKAFQLVNREHKVEQFDAVVVIRGGGAKADLFQLNEYEICKAICTAQLPVIVGIGHERDKTLLDEVACHTCHTPSLVIIHIVSTIVQNAQSAKQNWQTLTNLTTQKLQQAKAHNEQLHAQIRLQALKSLGNQRQQLVTLIQTVKNASQNQLNQAHQQIKMLMEQILLGDPKTILQHGYTIIRNNQQQVITSKMIAQLEDSLVIEFKDGWLSCRIEE